MKLTDLKKQLNPMDQNELVALICKLYKGSKQAQSIIDIELCGASAEEQLVSDCKKKIHAAFFGSKLSLKNARAVISNFKKASKSKENIAELMLFYSNAAWNSRTCTAILMKISTIVSNPCSLILSV